MHNHEDITVGLIRENGNFTTLSTGQSTHPDGIQDEVLVPISVPWAEDVQLQRLYIEEVERHDRSGMGRESYYSGSIEVDVPNSDQTWTLKVEFHEYPRGQFEPLRVEHSEHIRYANFNPEDLLSYMNATL